MAEYVQDPEDKEEDRKDKVVNPPPTLEEEQETEDDSNLYRDNQKNLNISIRNLRKLHEYMLARMVKRGRK
jgi:hypothetical protein